jgi:hypothetical protein
MGMNRNKDLNYELLIQDHELIGEILDIEDLIEEQNWLDELHESMPLFKYMESDK